MMAAMAKVRKVEAVKPTPVPIEEEAPQENQATIVADVHCPLLAVEAAIDRDGVYEDLKDDKGATIGRLVHRETSVTLERPTTCPTCGKIVESWMLPVDSYGTRDCSAALSMRSNPRFAGLLAALKVGDTDMVAIEAKALGFAGERVACVFAK
jgi:hypothetical protein